MDVCATTSLAQLAAAVLVRFEVGETLSRLNSFLHGEELPLLGQTLAASRQLGPLGGLCVDDGIHVEVILLFIVAAGCHRKGHSAERLRSHVSLLFGLPVILLSESKA